MYFLFLFMRENEREGERERERERESEREGGREGRGGSGEEREEAGSQTPCFLSIHGWCRSALTPQDQIVEVPVQKQVQIPMVQTVQRRERALTAMVTGCRGAQQCDWSSMDLRTVAGYRSGSGGYEATCRSFVVSYRRRRSATGSTSTPPPMLSE